MQEASKDTYFIDGFMLRHFGVWPLTLDKNNLFEEQKIFLIYLMGSIPDQGNWTMQVDYQKKVQDIKNIKKVEISKTDIDLAKLQNKKINDLEKEKIKKEKKRLLKELNEKFGIETKEDIEKTIIDEIQEENANKNKVETTQKEKLWDMLQMKGLVDKKQNG